MLANVTLTFCLVFNSKLKRKIVSLVFHNLSLGDNELNFMEKFNYLGHLISSDLSDDIDARREIRNMFVPLFCITIEYLFLLAV